MTTFGGHNIIIINIHHRFLANWTQNIRHSYQYSLEISTMGRAVKKMDYVILATNGMCEVSGFLSKGTMTKFRTSDRIQHIKCVYVKNTVDCFVYITIEHFSRPMYSEKVNINLQISRIIVYSVNKRQK